MSARTVLATHTSLFFSFVAASLASPFLVYAYPEIFVGKYIVGAAGVLMLLVISSWPLYGGCPFTVWENQLKKRTGEPTYTGGCIDHYALEWFGITLPSHLSTSVLVALLVLPIVAGAANW